MTESTPGSFQGPITAESLINTMKKFVEVIDIPILVRVSPAALLVLQGLPQPQFFGHPGFAVDPTISGLRIEPDPGLVGFQAEVEYRSGKIEQLNLDKREKV